MREYCTFPLTEVRIDGGSDQPVLIGHAAVFNQLSENLGGFREQIAPGAFSKTLGTADVRALWNHDPNFVLGRNKSGTLEMHEDHAGLRVTIKPPDTAYANDLMKLIKRGDVNQMSFGFRTVSDDFRMVDKELIRTLIEVELFDVSPVTYPAYPQTDIAARGAEFRSYIDGKIKAFHVEQALTNDQIKAAYQARQKKLDSIF